MANGVEVDVPVTSSEAHLDLLLAEELAVNQQFLRRFIEPARALTGTFPVSDVVTAVVRLNVWDDGGPSCVATDGGENDIDVAVTVGSHTMRVLIEDKVWAVFQPDQSERYRRRADSRGDTAVLVAPKSRLNDGAHTHCFHLTYAIEDLADWLDEQAGSNEGQWSQRLRWRVYKAVDVNAEGGIPGDMRAAFCWGIVSSAVTGYIAVWVILKLVRTRSFASFVLYRLVLGLAVLALVAVPFR